MQEESYNKYTHQVLDEYREQFLQKLLEPQWLNRGQESLKIAQRMSDNNCTHHVWAQSDELIVSKFVVTVLPNTLLERGRIPLSVPQNQS